MNGERQVCSRGFDGFSRANNQKSSSVSSCASVRPSWIRVPLQCQYTLLVVKHTVQIAKTSSSILPITSEIWVGSIVMLRTVYRSTTIFPQVSLRILDSFLELFPFFNLCNQHHHIFTSSPSLSPNTNSPLERRCLQLLPVPIKQIVPDVSASIDNARERGLKLFLLRRWRRSPCEQDKVRYLSP